MTVMLCCGASLGHLAFQGVTYVMRRPAGRCQTCNYSLCGHAVDVHRCPECGSLPSVVRQMESRPVVRVLLSLLILFGAPAIFVAGLLLFGT